MVLFWILASTFLVSLISLVGIFTLAIKENLLQKALFCLIGFSAGALIGSAFLHILPECLENNKSTTVFSYLIIGIIIFFIMERFLHWRHCHEEGACKTHAFTYLTLVGDGFHNFIDGMVIAASFMASFQLGVVTTLAIILHEIPQELSDFAILVYGGFTKKKALLFNFASALMAIIGALTGYFISDFVQGFSNFIMPLTAGGFIYIAMSDLIPEVHKESNQKRATLAFVAFLLGIVFMAAAKKFLPS
ncbi:MAG: ZIP family metal transporter [Candidatus Omnitrophica bacterium]|nr:ZIP family metal transporter [Candidatus Omnitrophota bacterium]MBU4303673.1 ZIP family metal transporter [Candidatus Omnitrophota bacterium]MBU4419170.1 ZIP family metal transporter [Candidatus Omnitrophota bacterium]MBU4467297.1 ZIP family metal transporter [Candidatus Omnitrophota bacterium]MCG2708283.1 ZIP family metal transporter [Candidatus Omnitrophota bacterium]